MRTRALSALLLVVPVAGLLWYGGLPWLAGLILIAYLGNRELYKALRQAGRRPLDVVGVFLAVALPGAAFADPTLALVPAVATIGIILSFVIVLVRSSVQGALEDWALSLAGSLYSAVLLAYFVALRQRSQGLEWMLLALLCTWACDSMAYLAGKALGRRPFAPRISPHKTWEGTVGGMMAAIAVGLLGAPLLGLPVWLCLLVGAAAGVAAIAGDLAESFLKRQLGIKDFSALIPGHGGVLDRIDSLLFVVPLVYYVALWWGGR